MTPDRWRQIETLYAAARERSPEERAVLLETSDPEVRDVVERMLAQESGSRILGESTEAHLFSPTETLRWARNSDLIESSLCSEPGVWAPSIGR